MTSQPPTSQRRLSKAPARRQDILEGVAALLDAGPPSETLSVSDAVRASAPARLQHAFRHDAAVTFIARDLDRYPMRRRLSAAINSGDAKALFLRFAA